MILSLHYQQSYQIHLELSRESTFKAKIACFHAGDFKLIEFFEDMNIELYNLRKDMQEDHNLALVMPDKAAELRLKLHRWRKEVNAAMPKPNPDYSANP